MSIKELINNLKEFENMKEYVVTVDFPNPFQIDIKINK